MMDIKEPKTAVVYRFFDQKSVNEQLAEELHKPVIEDFKRRKFYARFKDNIWQQI